MAGYDRKQGYPDPSEDVEVFARHGLGLESLVVDLGAGSGQFAVAGARRFGRVIAVDVSAEMLALLRRKLAEVDLTNVEVVQAGFMSYRHEGPRADGIYTRNALHHLPDFWKAIALVRLGRVMKKGGVLRLHDLIYDFAPDEANAVFAPWLDGAAQDPADGYTAADFIAHIRSEHSTFRWLFEPMLEATGFEVVDAESRDRVYGTYTCLRH